MPNSKYFFYFFFIAAETSIRIGEENTYLVEEQWTLRQPLSKVSINHRTWPRLLAAEMDNGNGWLSNGKSGSAVPTSLRRPVSTSHIKLLYLMGLSSSEPTERRTWRVWIYVYAVNTWCSHVFLTCYFFWHCSWTRRNPSQDPRSNCCTWSAGCVTSRQSAGLQRDEARWSLCLHYWCLVLTAKVDRQCLPDKHLVLRCQLHYNHHLVSALYIPRDAHFFNVLQNNSLL